MKKQAFQKKHPYTRSIIKNFNKRNHIVADQFYAVYCLNLRNIGLTRKIFSANLTSLYMHGAWLFNFCLINFTYCNKGINFKKLADTLVFATTTMRGKPNQHCCALVASLSYVLKIYFDHENKYVLLIFFSRNVNYSQ